MKKTLQELTIKNNFMFAAVMCQGDNCKRFLEMVLGIEIDRVEVDKEKSMVYNPRYKGVRLDVYAKDQDNTRYNVEMQAQSQEYLGKRARYYHSQIDMDMLTAGYEYSELPKGFVIFVCDFDPYGERKYLYEFESRCDQDLSMNMRDGRKTYFLSTKGKNANEASKELVKFLEFVGSELGESMADFEDDYVKRLQSTVKDIKLSREMEVRYMTLEEMLKDEFKAGKAEGKAEAILVLLEKSGKIEEELREQIYAQKDSDTISRWLILAAKADSIEQFMSEM